MKHLTLLLSLLLSLAVSVAGQTIILPEKPLQQRLSGALGQDELCDLAINWRGDLAAVGNAAKGDQGGQDISLIVYDAQLNKLLERHIGRQDDDGASQIAVLPDGRYLIAGYSTRPARHKARSSYFGKRDGWLLILNEQGDTEQERLLGTPDDDALTALSIDAEGYIWLAGNSGKDAWILRLSPALDIVWERRVRFRQLPTQVNAAALTPDGHFYVLGGTEEFDRKHLWLAGFDKQGKMLMEQIFPNSQAEWGTGIVALDSNSLAVTGSLYDPRNRDDGFLCLIDRGGVMRQYLPLGGREFDRVNTLIRLHNGQILAAGGSASFERGSRRISSWFSLLGPDAAIDQEKYYGSKLDDEVLGLAEHPDGRLFAIGTTARQVLKMRQGWLFQLTERSQREAKAGTLSAEIGPVRYWGDSKFLTGQQRAFLPIELENKGAKGQCNLRAVITGSDPGSANFLRLPGARSVLLPPIPAGGRFAWALPLKFAENTPSGRYRFKVQFYQGDKPFGEASTFEVLKGEQAQPRLTLSVTQPDAGFDVQKEGLLRIQVSNTGTETARSVTLAATPPPGVQCTSEYQLGDLPAGQTLDFDVALRPDAAAETNAPMHLRVSDLSLSHTDAAEIRLKITAPTASTPAKTNYTVAVWVYPNPDVFERGTIVWPQEEITVQVKVVSNQPVSRQQFCLEINGQPCQEGVKFEEVQIRGDQNSKTFSQTVQLKEGENTLRAAIRVQGEPVVSQPLHILYTPAKPNLHIVSIGIPSADLKYTGKDARDFAAALSSSSNRAFGKIFVDTLLSEGKTTKTEILKALRRLQYRHADLQILPKDLLVVFISGHGMSGHDGSFRLAASDYDAPFMPETSLDFEQELINYLQSLPCRKVFFVDACHSGTAGGSGLAGIATRKNGLNLLVSCQPDEYSYEDDHWQNGAFTRALVDGLVEFQRQPSGLDRDGNQALDLEEIFAFTQTEVPALVEKKKPRTKTGQRPNLILAEPGRPVILFEK